MAVKKYAEQSYKLENIMWCYWGWKNIEVSTRQSEITTRPGK
jgi:hypothetical protein